MTAFQDNLSPYISFAEHVDPSNPSAGNQRLFVDTDHILKMVDSAGTVTVFGTGLADPMTTRGDIIVRNAANATARLAVGGSGKVLSSDGTDISWQTPSSGGLTQAYVGYNTIGGTTENIVDLRQYMKKVTLANDCLMTSIGVYMKQVTTNSVIGWTCGVLTDVAGAPGIVIASQQGNASTNSGFYATNTGVAGSARWLDLPLGAWLVAGDYWIAVEANPSGTHQVYKDGSGGDRYFTNANLRISDSGWTSVTTSTDKYSIRANTIR